jgi:hypothetical protein
LITSCAHHRGLSLKEREKEKRRAKTSRFIFLMLIMHKKLLLILVLHFRREIILPMHFEPNYLHGTPLNLNFPQFLLKTYYKVKCEDVYSKVYVRK